MAIRALVRKSVQQASRAAVLLLMMQSPVWAQQIAPASVSKGNLPLSSNAIAGATELNSPPSEKKQSIYQKIWKFAEWYNNEQNPVIQNLLFSGRFQYEYAALDADQRSHDEGNVRRLRLGAKSKQIQN